MENNKMILLLGETAANAKNMGEGQKNIISFLANYEVYTFNENEIEIRNHIPEISYVLTKEEYYLNYFLYQLNKVFIINEEGEWEGVIFSESPPENFTFEELYQLSKENMEEDFPTIFICEKNVDKSFVDNFLQKINVITNLMTLIVTENISKVLSEKVEAYIISEETLKNNLEFFRKIPFILEGIEVVYNAEPPKDVNN